jgi:hypothetical protein
MVVSPNLNQFRQRLSETIAYCQPRVDKRDPMNCLRSLALWPKNRSRTPDKYGYYQYKWGTVEENEAVVVALAEERSRLLADTDQRDPLQVPQDLAGGRILVIVPEDSDTLGISERVSNGFIDGFDLPAWDTWIAYIGERSLLDPEEIDRLRAQHQAYMTQFRPNESQEWHPHPEVGAILCWIPAQFLELVNEGIFMNPMQCLYWATDAKSEVVYDTELFRAIEAAGLLG